MLTTICIYFAYYCGTAIVWQAWGITFGIVFGLTAYACMTKTDFSYKSIYIPYVFSWCNIHFLPNHPYVDNLPMFLAKLCTLHLLMFPICRDLWILLDLGNSIDYGQRSNNYNYKLEIKIIH
jgi:hypothetical protein